MKGMQSVNDMLAQKKKARHISTKANEKPKAFFAALDSSFEGVSQSMSANLAAKILINSRRVSLDKIAEIIGGKDDRSKELLEAYLDR